MKKVDDAYFLKLSDMVMETQAYIEFLEEQLNKHLIEETRNKYRKQLSIARKKLSTLEAEEKKFFERIDNNV